MDTTAIFKVSYGLYILTAKEGDFDNGCVINTFSQQTSNPMTVSITVNKANKTCEMIQNTGVFNVSVISENAPFSLFEHFGFHSGRDYNKFENFPNSDRAANGVYYIPGYTNAYFGCEVVETVDMGSHVMFIAKLTEAENLTDFASMTYAYYHANVKPKPQPAQKQGYRCKICGYFYEGETLPEDFVCPICKHGAEDFEKV